MKCETCYYYKGDKLKNGTFYPMPKEGTYTGVNCNKHPNGKVIISGEGCEDWITKEGK